MFITMFAVYTYTKAIYKIKDKDYRVVDVKSTVMTKILINYINLIDIKKIFDSLPDT